MLFLNPLNPLNFRETVLILPLATQFGVYNFALTLYNI